MQTSIIKCATTKEAWDFLEKFLTLIFHIHVKFLLHKVCTTKHSSFVSMFDYLMVIRNIVDALEASGTTVSDDDLVMYVVDGLFPSYKAFQTALSMRGSPVTFDEIHILLLTEEDLLSRTGETTENPPAFYESKERSKRKQPKNKSIKNNSSAPATNFSTTTPSQGTDSALASVTTAMTTPTVVSIPTVVTPPQLIVLHRFYLLHPL